MCDAGRASPGSDRHSAVYGLVSSHDIMAHAANLTNKTPDNPQQGVG